MSQLPQIIIIVITIIISSSSSSTNCALATCFGNLWVTVHLHALLYFGQCLSFC